MLVSFPMDDATEKRSNCSYATSERAQHEGLFGTGDFSRDFSGENVSLSKCHCSDQITSIGVPLGELNGQWSPFGIETSEVLVVVVALLLSAKWPVEPVRDGNA